MVESTASPNENQAILIRRAYPDDAEVCGKICFDAFTTLGKQHNFPPDFPFRKLPSACSRRCFRTPRSSAWSLSKMEN